MVFTFRGNVYHFISHTTNPISASFTVSLYQAQNWEHENS